MENELKSMMILLAGLEQIETVGKINAKELFARAKDLYNFAHQYKVNEWTSVWEENPKTEKEKVKAPKQEIKDEKKVEIKQTEKYCSNCGEMVPVAWKKHGYKKNGEVCGYEIK